MEEKRRKWTKEYKCAYLKRWRAENKEHAKAYRREYYLRTLLTGKTYPVDKEKNRENVKRWRERNREKYNAYQREYARKKRAEVRV